MLFSEMNAKDTLKTTKQKMAKYQARVFRTNQCD